MRKDNFLKPERPFFLMAEDEHGEISYFWLETEEELVETAKEITLSGLTITDSIEIGSIRDIEL
jgi:hypothetical protein